MSGPGGAERRAGEDRRKGADLRVREAEERDVPAIADLFRVVYGDDYPYENFLGPDGLKRAIYGDNVLMLVAEDSETEQVLGTGSVVFDIGAHSDLIGEFGRRVVHPDGRGRGVGSAIMGRRCALIENRLHAGVVENRTVHPFSQRISHAHGFAAVGFLPMKHLFRRRESVALFCRHFGNALALRRNHPRIVPEVHSLAHLALSHCGLPRDVVVDEQAAPSPMGEGYQLEELTASGLPTLLRIERGRIGSREVFGPMRLQYGFFKLTARRARYLVAREPTAGADGPVAAALGYIYDEVERAVRVFELIVRDDEAAPFLFAELLRRCEGEHPADYIEVDVSAHAPRLQRTLVQLRFVPAAYVPAMAFHEVERLDVIKFVHLTMAPDIGDVQLTPDMEAIQSRVMAGLTRRSIRPEVARMAAELPLFEGLGEEQLSRVAGVCEVRHASEGENLFHPGDPTEEIFLVLDGSVEVGDPGQASPLAAMGPGDCLGELALVLGAEHALWARAREECRLAVLSLLDLQELSRRRPDIAVRLYRNLAAELGRKLRGRSSAAALQRPAAEPAA